LLDRREAAGKRVEYHHLDLSKKKKKKKEWKKTWNPSVRNTNALNAFGLCGTLRKA
jgi:hypothetical protein